MGRRPKTRRKGRNKRKRRTAPPRARVFLDEAAFIVLVAAATESYRRECYGVLLGRRQRGLTYVRAAVAYQTARRKFKSVELADGRRRVMRQVLAGFPHYDYLGEFHSHPGYGDEPGVTKISEPDLTGVRPGECQLVLAVRRHPAVQPWQHCADGTLSGAVGGYLVKLKAYLPVTRKNGRPAGHPVGLKCAYAVSTASSRRLLARRRQGRGP